MSRIALSRPTPNRTVSREEARAKGYKFFFTGQRCRNGHVAERWTRSGMCYQCSKARWAKKRAALLASFFFLFATNVAGAQCAVPGAATAPPPDPTVPPTSTITVDTSNPVAPVPSTGTAAPIPDTTNLVAPQPGAVSCGGPPPPPPPPVDGVCGSAAGAASATAPTTNLCSAGTASLVTTDGVNWDWSCAGTNGGATALCTAPVITPTPVNGVCGPAAGVATSTAPTTNLCTAGTPGTVTSDGTNWNWVCAGSNGGTDAACTAPVLVAPPGTETLGETAVFPTVDCCNRSLLLVQDAVLAANGTLESLSFYAIKKAGYLRLGLYDATGPNGGPGKLLAQTPSFQTVVGWNTHPVTPVSLPAGNYWLAYTPSSNNLQFGVERDYGNCFWANRSYQAMPAKFPFVVGSDQCHWSFYATLTTP